MAEILLKLLVAFLLVLGLVELFRAVLFWVLKPKHSGRVYFVVEITGHDEEAERKLRNAVEKMKWLGGREKKQVLCVDNGMDPETKEICRMLCVNEPLVTICTPEQLPDRIAA